MRNGMTLLELLLVIGIIGVVATSGAPFVARSMGWAIQQTETLRFRFRACE